MGTAVRVLSIFLLKAFRLSLDDSLCQLKSIFSFDFCFEPPSIVENSSSIPWILRVKPKESSALKKSLILGLVFLVNFK